MPRTGKTSASSAGGRTGCSIALAALAFLVSGAIAAQPVSGSGARAAALSAEPVPGAAAGTETAGRLPGAVEELFDHVRFLQEELRQLRRLLEQQGHKLSTAERRQLDRYLDIDRRLAALETAGAATAVETQRRAEDAPAPLSPGEQSAYRRAYAQVKSGTYSEATVSFLSFLEQWPAGEYAANAWYWLGELHLAAAPPQLAEAGQAFSQVLEKFSSHHKVPDAMFKLGKVRHLQGETEQAQAMLQEVVEKYGDNAGSAARLAEAYLRQYFQ